MADTLLRAEGLVVGVNTNAYAAGMALCHLAGSKPPEQVLVIGTAAAARSVALGARRISPDVTVLFAGRSADRRRQIVADLGFGTCVSDLSSIRPDAVINATTVDEN